MLYELGPTKEIDGNVAYVNQGGSPWGNSNVMAKVMGIVKTNTSVYSEQRGNGYCARLETHIESVKVLGMVNITVLASGSMFLGDMKEPITGTKDGEKALNSGLPFTSRPKAVRYDYRCKCLDNRTVFVRPDSARRLLCRGRIVRLWFVCCRNVRKMRKETLLLSE